MMCERCGDVGVVLNEDECLCEACAVAVARSKVFTSVWAMRGKTFDDAYAASVEEGEKVKETLKGLQAGAKGDMLAVRMRKDVPPNNK